MPLHAAAIPNRMVPTHFSNEFWHCSHEDSFRCAEELYYPLHPANGRLDAQFVPFAFGFRPWLVVDTSLGTWRLTARFHYNWSENVPSGTGDEIPDDFVYSCSEWLNFIKENLDVGVGLPPLGYWDGAKYGCQYPFADVRVMVADPDGCWFNDNDTYHHQYVAFFFWARFLKKKILRNAFIPGLNDDPFVIAKRLSDARHTWTMTQKTPLSVTQYDVPCDWQRSYLGLVVADAPSDLGDDDPLFALPVPAVQVKRFYNHLVWNEGLAFN